MMLKRLIYTLHRILSITWRIKQSSPSEQCVIGVWHEDIPTLLKVLSHLDIGAQVSQSQDGEILDFIFKQYGYKTFRGSSSKGFQSTRACLRFINAGHSMTMALDGPNGPRRIVKPGSQWLATKSQLPLYIVQCTYSNAWRLNSWDQMAWPKPFTKINLKFQLYTQLDAKFTVTKEKS